MYRTYIACIWFKLSFQGGFGRSPPQDSRYDAAREEKEHEQLELMKKLTEAVVGKTSKSKRRGGIACGRLETCTFNGSLVSCAMLDPTVFCFTWFDLALLYLTLLVST